MKKRILKKIVVILLFSFIILISIKDINILDIANIYIYKFSDPIDKNGMINNYYFNISKEGKNPEETTKGINKAISYANKNNIKYIQFERGEYCIAGYGRNGQIGIEVTSNIKINFNGAKIFQETNSSEHYTTMSINKSNNVEIENVNVIGDKESHNYREGNSIHDDGMGIRIQASNNVKINNVNITDMTGDGIIIAYGAKNVNIMNTTISNCRRQGISVVEGEDIHIHNNEIFNIKGVGPQALIDIETFQEGKYVKNVDIYENKFYNSNSNTAILLYSGGENISIYNNEINGSVHIYNIIGMISINNNYLLNGYIKTFDLSKFNIDNIEIINNKLNKYYMEITKFNTVNMKNNIGID